MTDPEGTPPLNEVAAFTSRLRELSGRMARFERVDQAELDAFEAGKAGMLGRIRDE